MNLKYGYEDKNLLDLYYPVGTVYINSTNTDPSTVLGGAAGV